MLAFLGLPPEGAQSPLQLSGGQQQRVALARALVVEPDVLLLDEPLSNLDVTLRVRVRTELKEIQRALGKTTILVTHDQEEALSISDRIAVFDAGRKAVGRNTTVTRSRAPNDPSSGVNRPRGESSSTAPPPPSCAVAGTKFAIPTKSATKGSVGLV